MIKQKLLGNGLIKAVAIAFFVLSIITFALTTVSIIALSEADAYKKEADFEKQREWLYSDFAYRYAHGSALRYLENSGVYEEDKEIERTYFSAYGYNESLNGEGMNFDYELYDTDGKLLSHNQESRSNGNYRYTKTFDITVRYGQKKVGEATTSWYPEYSVEDVINQELYDAMLQYGADHYEVISYYSLDQETGGTRYARMALYKTCELNYSAQIGLYADPLITDHYSLVGDLLETGYSLRYTVIALCVLSFILTLVLFVYLILAAGRRRDREGIVRNPMDKIPYDLFTLAVGGLIALAAVFVEWVFDYADEDFIVPVMLGIFAAGILGLLLFTLWLMSTSTRIKYGRWWRNTLIVMVITGIFKGIASLLRAIPVIWKSILFLLVVGFLNLFAFALAMDWYSEFGVLLWIVDWFLITAVVIGCSVAYRYLSKGAAKIARGEPDARINTTNLLFDFKTLGENLNSIDDGIRQAVDEQMKSERLKTELITNVSHDIKTPLTSIINYVDLLERDGSVTDEGLTYLEVLSRQSARLKKLIEDLIQASKASTGNLETHMVPTDSVVLGQQIVGEYRDRLEEAGLEMICGVETENATILADGQLLYRVFDNLLGNICKYAQPGTRVYLDVTETVGRIRFVFRNISKNPLHISPDELTERFVRGDASRTTEGSGLGLSIAKSLTELQGGSFDIEIDGDLFKAILQFDSIGTNV